MEVPLAEWLGRFEAERCEPAFVARGLTTVQLVCEDTLSWKTPEIAIHRASATDFTTLRRRLHRDARGELRAASRAHLS